MRPEWDVRPGFNQVALRIIPNDSVNLYFPSSLSAKLDTNLLAGDLVSPTCISFSYRGTYGTIRVKHRCRDVFFFTFDNDDDDKIYQIIQFSSCTFRRIFLPTVNIAHDPLYIN